MSCGNTNTSADESQITPRAKLEAGESLNDADRKLLLELLHDRDLLEKMAVGHVQAVLSGEDSENDDEDPFSFPPRPDRESEQDSDPFEFPERL
jgi:hypothetical protein